MVMPLVYAVSSSLKPLDEIWAFPPRFFVQNPTLTNFRDLLSLLGTGWVPFSRYVFNTLFVSIVGTIGHVIISSLCAYALAKHQFPGKAIMFSTVVFSLMFSSAVTSVPSFWLMSRVGLVNSLWVYILPAFSAPLGLYLMKQFMETGIPDSLIESAYLDGANEWRVFWKLVMPLVKPAWLTLTLFSFQGLWNAGANPLVRTEHLKTLNYVLSQLVSGGIARVGTSAAASVVMMFFPIAVFVITQSNVIETVASSGMKE